jgi:hypothetical protein
MDDEVTFVTKPCPVCAQTSRIKLSFADLERWFEGEHVQNVWPYMDADRRELLISGTHPPCWTLMMTGLSDE